METSTQILAVLLARLHADIALAQVSVDRLLEHKQATPAGKTGPLPPLQDTPPRYDLPTAENGVQRVLGQDRVIDVWDFKDQLPPELKDTAIVLWQAGIDGVTAHLTTAQIHQRLSDAALTVDTFWRMRGMTADGSIQQFNAVLVLALGPAAPQFVAEGDGWALVATDD
jgi:hypothetical protein